ncbi:hypothetical protein EV13_1745 [Prochlorococcus sp. MIT 0702]|nr:hypothetical protein EV12_1518 [Prochlorococcus sp. MIT 0701]KGG27852.1 hypothetical protein EV13_1745 [Prochlorococcus sp. MIT 0702]KGG31425.1 hypothetical protein EV14_2376 [Prochlorococcus sp. MIT 0703]
MCCIYFCWFKFSLLLINLLVNSLSSVVIFLLLGDESSESQCFPFRH